MQELPQYVMTGLVLLWGIRLTSHIGFRKLREGREDPRYAKWRTEWGSGWYFIIRSYLQVFLLQMVLMLIVATPILVVNFSDSTSLSFSFIPMMDTWIESIVQNPQEPILLLL
jgi:steroid 5-alpha reductase family enzyme